MFISLMLMVFIEIYAFTWVCSKIGGIKTLIIVLGTGIIGAVMARNHAKDALRQLMKRKGENSAAPARQMFDAVAFFLAAALLIIPGIITDIIGILILLPPTRAFLYSKFIKNSEGEREFTAGFNSTRHRSRTSIEPDSAIDITAEEVDE
jgi:UPF0716 protein FxsA